MRIQSLFVLYILTAQVSLAAELGLGMNLMNYSYKEELTPPAKSSEAGMLATVIANLSLPASGMGGRSYVDIEGEIVVDGNTDYEGTTLSTNSPANATDKNTILRMESNLYYNLTGDFFLHGGYGYRYWKRYLTFGSGYKEQYTWSYLPIGLLYSRQMSSDFKLGIDFSYRVMLNGKIKVIFSETVTSGDDTTLDLGNRPGYRISLPMEIGTSGKIKFQLRPWFEHSEIGESNTAYNNTPTGASTVLGYIQEPSSKTDQYGVIVAFCLGL